MNFKLFSKECRTRRLIAALALAFLAVAYLWLTAVEFRSGYFRPSALGSNFFWFIFSFLLPLGGCVGILREKHWGIQQASIWFIVSAISFEIGLALLGPRFETPKLWVLLPAWAALLLTIGPRELWGSLWFRPASPKRFFPNWAHKEVIPISYEKGALAALVLLVQVLLALSWILVGRFIGFSYPALTEAPPSLGTPSLGGHFVSPAGFQVEIPPSVRVMGLFPNYGDMALLADGQYWAFKSNYQVAGLLKYYVRSPQDMERFLAERYGIVPRTIKSLSWFFGDRPSLYFQIKKGDLWEVVSLKLGKVSRTPKVFVCVMDGQGVLLGSLEVEVSSTDPKDWQWIYTVERTDPNFWTPEKFEEIAREFGREGKDDLATLYLSLAVMGARDKGPYYKALVEYMASHGNVERARRFLHEAKMEYQNDPAVQAIKMPGK